ncbi:MAG: DHA3 family macrolide efflux protein-like MFS transporter [Glaciecola sp.]|jgi:DHA3 family macrolide efflux protein-like MFS transporter
MSRDVNRAVFARFVTNTGAEASFFIGMWGKAAYQFQADATALAVMAVLILAASVVGNIIGGVMVDRLDARRVLIAAEFTLIPSLLVLLLADSLTLLLALGAITFLLHGIEETAATSLPPALIERGDDKALVAVNARLESAGWIAMVAGPGLGGLLAGFANLDAVFIFDAATSLASALLLLSINLAAPAAPPQGDTELSGIGEVMAGLRIARRTPAIAFAMILGSLLWFGFGAFVALEPLYFRDVLGEGPAVLGYVNAVFGVGLFAGSVACGRWGRRFGFRHATALAAVTGLGAIVYVGSSSLWIVVVGALAWGIPLGMILPVVRTLAQRAAPEGMVGRVMGTIATAQNMTSVLPAAFVPFLAVRFGVQTVLIGGALVPIVALPLLIGRARRLDLAAGDESLDIRPDPHPAAATPLP